jgi:ADP-ribose pyrophosphatase YjhB (NUDIX family)
MGRLTGYILGLATGFIVNIASSEIHAKFPQIGLYFITILSLIMVGWLFYFVAFKAGFFRSRFAVLIFVLDQSNRILLIKHPYHRRLLPPGGRLKTGELPHEAVGSKLREEAGITAFEFDKIFHHQIRKSQSISNSALTDNVEEVVCPYYVHLEHRRQRDGVEGHYAFVYVCRVNNGSLNMKSLDYNPRFYSMEEFDDLNFSERPFEDVILRYAIILRRINGGKINEN